MFAQKKQPSKITENRESRQSAKTYWSILKSLLNNKKIPRIPPLFHQNKYVTGFKKKTELFNCFFAKQCSIVNNSSELPFNLCTKTDKSISTVTFTSDDIATLIQNIDPNKAHGQDMLSSHMLKLCGKSMCKTAWFILQSCIKHGEFPTEWKKANAFPVHKKKWQIDFKKLSTRIFTSDLWKNPWTLNL